MRADQNPAEFILDIAADRGIMKTSPSAAAAAVDGGGGGGAASGGAATGTGTGGGGGGGGRRGLSSSAVAAATALSALDLADLCRSTNHATASAVNGEDVAGMLVQDASRRRQSRSLLPPQLQSQQSSGSLSLSASEASPLPLSPSRQVSAVSGGDARTISSLTVSTNFPSSSIHSTTGSSAVFIGRNSVLHHSSGASSTASAASAVVGRGSGAPPVGPTARVLAARAVRAMLADVRLSISVCVFVCDAVALSSSSCSSSL